MLEGHSSFCPMAAGLTPGKGCLQSRIKLNGSATAYTQPDSPVDQRGKTLLFFMLCNVHLFAMQRHPEPLSAWLPVAAL